MRSVVIGASGQLAYDLIPLLASNDHEVAGLTHHDIEVEDLGSVMKALRSAEPEIVINTSAYHRVDDAEDDPMRAFAVNAVGPRNLAVVCREIDTPLLHMSTDYVFSGLQRTPRSESDEVDPVNIYGISKVAGEMSLRYLSPRHYIVRSGGLYGVAGSSGKGGNFVERMLGLAAEGLQIKVVDDQTLTPTSTSALAAQIVALISTERYGTYHATCQGECTWYEFAQEVLRIRGVDAELASQSTTESGAKALRPAYSVLENEGLSSMGLDKMPPWKDALRDYLDEGKATGDG